MMAASFDTLEISKRLRGAGFSEPQAEAMTAVLRDSREFDLAQLAALPMPDGYRRSIRDWQARRATAS